MPWPWRTYLIYLLAVVAAAVAGGEGPVGHGAVGAVEGPSGPVDHGRAAAGTELHDKHHAACALQTSGNEQWLGLPNIPKHTRYKWSRECHLQSLRIECVVGLDCRNERVEGLVLVCASPQSRDPGRERCRDPPRRLITRSGCTDRSLLFVLRPALRHVHGLWHPRL